MSHIVRVDSEVYGLMIQAKALLELATRHPVSFSDTVAFIMALRGIAGADI
jgi:hypothetical protein